MVFWIVLCKLARFLGQLLLLNYSPYENETVLFPFLSLTFANFYPSLFMAFFAYLCVLVSLRRVSAYVRPHVCGGAAFYQNFGHWNIGPGTISLRAVYHPDLDNYIVSCSVILSIRRMLSTFPLVDCFPGLLFLLIFFPQNLT